MSEITCVTRSRTSCTGIIFYSMVILFSTSFYKFVTHTFCSWRPLCRFGIESHFLWCCLRLSLIFSFSLDEYLRSSPPFNSCVFCRKQCLLSLSHSPESHSLSSAPHLRVRTFSPSQKSESEIMLFVFVSLSPSPGKFMRKELSVMAAFVFLL